MKSTWKQSDAPQRRKMTLGFLLFVAGISIASYCGCMERYAGEPQAEILKIGGWGMLLVGSILFTLGIFQSSIRRR